jgi:hypothetical protein
LGTALSQTHPVHSVVKATLQQLEENFTGDAALPDGFRVIRAELLLKNAIDSANLLLLTETDRVLRELLSCLAMLAGAISAANNCALGAVAAVTLKEKLDPFSAAEPAHGVGITSHLANLLAGALEHPRRRAFAGFDRGSVD